MFESINLQQKSKIADERSDQVKASYRNQYAKIENLKQESKMQNKLSIMLHSLKTITVNIIFSKCCFTFLYQNNKT